MRESLPTSLCTANNIQQSMYILLATAVLPTKPNFGWRIESRVDRIVWIWALRLLCCLCTYCVLNNNFLYLQTFIMRSYRSSLTMWREFQYPCLSWYPSFIPHQNYHSPQFTIHYTQDQEKKKMFRLRKNKVLPQQVSDFGAFLFVVTMIPITYIWEVRTETKMPQWFHSAHYF